jgi:outer membrane receptor protein involved in Fe transport
MLDAGCKKPILDTGHWILDIKPDTGHWSLDTGFKNVFNQKPVSSIQYQAFIIEYPVSSFYYPVSKKWS